MPPLKENMNILYNSVFAADGGVPRMASLSSFDIVSDFDQQELKNALDQAQREILQRYDLKDTKTTIEATDSQLTINSDSEYTLSAVRDLIESKFVRRGLSLKILDYGEEE